MARRKTRKKKPIAPMNPRERLTKKARAAIELYTFLQSEKTGNYAHFMIGHVLKAERMRRAQLYDYLESIGYRWRPPYWEIRDIHGRLVAGYCSKERRPKPKGTT